MVATPPWPEAGSALGHGFPEGRAALPGCLISAAQESRRFLRGGPPSSPSRQALGGEPAAQRAGLLQHLAASRRARPGDGPGRGANRRRFMMGPTRANYSVLLVIGQDGDCRRAPAPRPAGGGAVGLATGIPRVLGRMLSPGGCPLLKEGRPGGGCRCPAALLAAAVVAGFSGGPAFWRHAGAPELVRQARGYLRGLTRSGTVSGRVTVLLVSRPGDPGARLLVDGRSVGAFRTPTVTARVRPGNTLRVVAGGPGADVFRVVRVSPGLSASLLGRQVTVSGGGVLGRVGSGR
jgi:hypothetical protein